MGKSGIIAHKVAATFASTGTPALFVHPAEAIHGDLGMITPSDLVLAISNSGETEEVLKLLPVLEVMQVPVIAMTSRRDSTLAGFAEVHLEIPLAEEGCPIGLAPMASTTACLALGDALAASLMCRQGFQPSDYALFHPGGSLGRKLLTRVRDLMVGIDECPALAPETPFHEALKAMISSNLGAILVVEGGKLVGLLTDGDIKRLFERLEGHDETPVEDVMTREPRTIGPGVMAERGLRVMEDGPRQVTVLPVVEDDGTAVGLIRLHDILRAKIR
jgi:arabinose-5-phosphate isomerase